MSDNIIPHGVDSRGARVRDISFRVRTLVDYDVRLMNDRVIAESFIGHVPTGHYASVHAVHETGTPWRGGEKLLEAHGDSVERRVIDAYLELGYEAEVTALWRQLRDLKEKLDRNPWWHLRRWIRNTWAAR